MVVLETHVWGQTAEDQERGLCRRASPVESWRTTLMRWIATEDLAANVARVIDPIGARAG